MLKRQLLQAGEIFVICFVFIFLSLNIVSLLRMVDEFQQGVDLIKKELRDKQIEKILSENWQKFTDWQKRTGANRTIAIPQDIVAVCIPRRILELSQDPTKVYTYCSESDLDGDGSSSLGVLIYERLFYPITDAAKYAEWVKTVKSPRILPSSQQEAPNGIDYKHTGYIDLIQKGVLTFSDKVYLHYWVNVNGKHPNAVKTRNLSDRSETHRIGIGSSFYQQMENVYRQLGFKYLIGDIISPHPDFFARQRVLYQVLTPQQQSELPPPSPNAPSYMVKVL